MKSTKKNIMILSVVGFASLSILFSGCSRTATTGFQKDPIYAQNLQYTKVGKIVKNNEVEFLVNVTYLNSADSSKWNNDRQNFLVGTYITNKDDTTYEATVDNLEPLLIEDIDKDDNMYQHIALLNKWADYKILSFSDNNTTNVVLRYSSSNDNNVSLSFIKE
ncbi:MAG: hypothetical protein U9R39_02645 [Campylobacterota bacterium]|nr:hypothetical protein [Campylobacterota bacterium]